MLDGFNAAFQLIFQAFENLLEENYFFQLLIALSLGIIIIVWLFNAIRNRN